MKGLRGKALAFYKQEIVLTPEQHHLIIGFLLGDGSMRCPGRSYHANLTVEHGVAQKEYVWWKYEYFKKWVLTPPTEVQRIYHKDSNRTLVSWRFSTITHEAFTDYYKLFYRNGMKTIPENISDLFTHPLSLAVWLMDDGNKTKDVLFLNTQNFALCEQDVLRYCLWETFHIDSTLNFHSHSQGHRLYRIRLTREGTKRACKIIMPYVLPSLMYKFSAIPL